jgi:carboxypeptidase Taq
MQEKVQELRRRYAEASAIGSIGALMGWDQQVMMPPGGAPARGRQMAIISRIGQEMATDPAIGHLLDELAPYAESLPYDSEEAAELRAIRRWFERNNKVSPAFVAEYSEHTTASFQTWREARPANDFAKVQPYLERTLDLSRRLADFFPGYDHIADPLIDFADYGMKAADIARVFAELRSGLVPLIRKIAQQPQVDDSMLHRHFPGLAQIDFSKQVIQDFGYDFKRGRLDLAPHPFSTGFSVNDSRITTRIKENDLPECLLSVFHESGHAMYEMGCNPEYEARALQGGVSSGVHESQSRTWENRVGRSRPFWEHYFPILQTYFPEQLKDVSVEAFYRAINKVQPSLIRTEADEVTYNLHPMLRFDLELSLLTGELAVKDLPEAWNARYEHDLGITVPNDTDGVMQDIHWYGGGIGGAFQGYTLGNILSAQFMEKALQEHPSIPDMIRQGNFQSLHGWLKENIYRWGSYYTAPELIQKVVGGLNVQPLLRYLNEKYGEIYGI